MKNVAVVVQDGAEPFGLGSICEVWAEPYHPEDDNPGLRVHRVHRRTGTHQGRIGIRPARRARAGGARDGRSRVHRPQARLPDNDPRAVEAVRKAADRGAIISAHCTAAWLLGDAGLLDGRDCTTHWRYADRLAEAFPEGARHSRRALRLRRQRPHRRRAAGRHRRRSAPDARARSAPAPPPNGPPHGRPPHRDGGQAQFVRTPMGQTEADTLAPLLEWAPNELDEPMPVERWRRRRTCRRAPSPGASGTRPAPRRCSGSPASDSRSPRSCWRTRPCRSSRSPRASASATRPPCATTSRRRAAPRRRRTAGRSRAWRTQVELVSVRSSAPCRSRCEGSSVDPVVLLRSLGRREPLARSVAQRLLGRRRRRRRRTPADPSARRDAEDRDVLESGGARRGRPRPRPGRR